jgi:hypothetical protein
VIARATAVLHAFARSDTDALDLLCSDDVFVWGTDADERWHGKAVLLDAVRGSYDLAVRWEGEPIPGHDWVAGVVEFESPDGPPVRARVSMIFRSELLTHAHYSVAQ